MMMPQGPGSRSRGATAERQLRNRRGDAVMNSAARFARFPGMAAIDHAGWARFVVIGLGILATYVLLDFLSYVRWFGASGIAPWNPAIGMSVALLIRTGWRYAIWLFPAAILSEAPIRHGIDGWAARIAVAAAGAPAYCGPGRCFQQGSVR